MEVHLKIKLPVAVINIAGNAKEGSQIIHNKEQIYNHHNDQVKIDIADVHPVKYWLKIKYVMAIMNPIYYTS